MKKPKKYCCHSCGNELLSVELDDDYLAFKTTYIGPCERCIRERINAWKEEFLAGKKANDES